METNVIGFTKPQDPLDFSPDEDVGVVEIGELVDTKARHYFLDADHIELLNPPSKFGILFNVPEEDYRASDGIAQSALKEMDLSPAHFRVAAKDGVPEEAGEDDGEEDDAEEEKKPAYLDFGTAFHTAVLEPKRYNERYHIPPPEVNLRNKAGKAWKQAIKDQGDEVIKVKDANKVYAMRVSLLDNPIARMAIRESRPEVAIYAPINVEGVILQRKGRVDLMADSGITLSDIKTARYGRGHPQEWGKQVSQCFYHVQSAYYLDIVNSVIGTEQFTEFVHIVVEKEKPFAVSCYRVTKEAIEAGRSLYMAWLQRVAECTKSGEWPGYPTHLMPVDLPKWKTGKMVEPLD